MVEHRTQVSRIHSLDALRGIAAFWVLMSHCLMSVPGTLSVTSPWYRFTPLRLLASGQFPVILFFVLSGFVLARQILKQPELTYPQFATRRFCRIYIPYAASIISAWVLANLIGAPQVPGVAESINSDWVGSTSLEALARHLLMLGRHEDTNLNGVAWTLIIEMRISLLFPILMLIFLQVRWSSLVLAAIPMLAYAVAVKLGQNPPFYFGANIALSMVITAYFLLPFLVGMLLARYNHYWTRDIGGLAAAAGVIISMLGVAFVLRLQLQPVRDIAFSLIAGFLILLALKSEAFSRVLSGPVLQWLGKVSYSLYLFHVIVINFLLKGFSSEIDLSLLVLIALPLSLFVADVAYRLFEQPAIHLGRALTQGRVEVATADAARR